MAAHPISPIIVDTDPGVGIPGTDADDPIALFLALAHPGIELLGVTTIFGNCPPELGARGAQAVLNSAGRPGIPVIAGAAHPLAGPLPELLTTAYTGARGREGRIPLPEAPASTLNAAEFIVETVRSRPGEVTVVAIGAQTNIAQALRLDPAITGLIKEIVFMGGALGLPPHHISGNVTPQAECNIWFDPDAAGIVLQAGIPLRMAGLDVTNPGTGLVLTADAIGSLERGVSPALDLFAEICSIYLESPMFVHGGGCVLYDPLAMAIAGGTPWARFETVGITIDTSDGPARGRTQRADGGGTPVEVCVDVDGRRVVADILQTISTLSELRAAGLRRSCSLTPPPQPSAAISEGGSGEHER